VHHMGSAADVDEFVADLRKIVREEGAVFGEFPAYEGGRYVFLADYLPWAIGDGMEHRNSTVISGSVSLSSGRRLALDAAAHEYFHGWNVERIRPRGLEPFNLDDQNVTGELWLAEGVTSYYEMLVQQRAGVSPLDDLAGDINRVVGEVMTSPSHAFRSAADMSRMAPFVDGESPQDRTNLGLTFISYYTYGAALGIGFDLSIREKTGGAHSLDDVMRWLWVRHGKPGGAHPGTVDRPYGSGDVNDALAAVTGDREWADRLIADYVTGRRVMDYGRLLALAGFVVTRRSTGEASLGLIPIERSGGRVRLVGPAPPDSPAAAAGLGADDELIAIDHRSLSDGGGLEATLRRYRPGDRVTLTAQLRGESAPRDLPVVLTEDTRVEITTLEQIGKAPDARQRAFREQWLGRR
jgi:predicted metalloprotease with PDZ domain